MRTSRSIRKNKTHKMGDEQLDEKHLARKDGRKKEALNEHQAWRMSSSHKKTAQ